MFIVLALVAACVVGIALHFVVPGRSLRGIAIAPVTAVAAAAVLYTALQWAGLAESSFVLWAVTILVSAAIAYLVAFTVSWRRERADAAEKAALGI